MSAKALKQPDLNEADDAWAKYEEGSLMNTILMHFLPPGMS